MQIQLQQFVSLVVLSSWGFLGGLASPIGSPRELASRGAGDVHLYKRFSNSKWSFYDVGLGACGETNVESDFIVALNAEQFGSGYPGPHCKKTITMTYNGKTARAKVMDRCPGCPYGGLDLSRSLFRYFDSEDKGIIYGSWEFSDASAPATTTRAATTPTPKTTSTTRAASTSQAAATTSRSSQPAPTPTTSRASPANNAAAGSSTGPSSRATSVAAVTAAARSQAPAQVATSSVPQAQSSKAPTPSASAVEDEYEYEDCGVEEDDEPLSATSSQAAKIATSVPRSSSALPVANLVATSSGASPSAPSESTATSSSTIISGSPSPSASTTEEQIEEHWNLLSQLFAQLGDLIQSLIQKDGKASTA